MVPSLEILWIFFQLYFEKEELRSRNRMRRDGMDGMDGTDGTDGTRKLETRDGTTFWSSRGALGRTSM